MRYLLQCLSVAGLAIVVGCGTPSGSGDSKTPATPTGGKASDGNAKAAEGAAEKKVELKILAAADIFATIRRQTGKVVVVDCWTTYCEPCKKEFPGLLKLQEKHGDKVFCMSVSLDFSGLGKPEEVLEEPMKFLKGQKATILNVLSSTGDEDFLKAIGREFKLPSAPAGVPVILVFDREGKLVNRWDTTNIAEEKDFSYAKSVAPVVEKLVK
jgi:thiol-disulfide isomerase/thioredoxin